MINTQGLITGHTDEVNGLSFMAAGPRLTVATCSDDKTVCLWDVSAITVTIKVQLAKALKAAK